MHKYHYLLVSNLFLINSFFANVSLAAEVKNCQVKFETTATPVIIKIEGKADSGCKGDLKEEGDKVTGEFSIDPNTLDTKIELRNKHLKENYLETAKYKDLTLKLKSVDKKANKFEADLTMHGQTKPVSGTFSISGKKVTVNFSVELGIWGIKRPEFMKVIVADAVKMTVEFEK